MVVVRLLDRFVVTSGGVAMHVPASAHRLVALLALRGSPVERSYVSQCLWMDKTEARAYANLRSVIWRLRRSSPQLVSLSASHLSLRRDVEVDIDALRGLARALVDESSAVELSEVDAESLSGELLPGWSDDFVELERERLRQMRLHALESLSHRLLCAGRHALALDAALAAVAADPLRETAHRAAIAVHLAEGNLGEALRQFSSLADLLARELGIAPSRRTADLVDVRSDWAGPAPRQSNDDCRHAVLLTLETRDFVERKLQAIARERSRPQNVFRSCEREGRVADSHTDTPFSDVKCHRTHAIILSSFQDDRARSCLRYRLVRA